ncbi:hypothetical protein BCR44DRAFT_1297345 [Catenaria anguillulae PL171]|uniref:Secreted protein n=1 Tax=Catenaria anguillulae PL171 TaxID=765915 RepID=A0A1Y2HA91_9FUNG|nr:hypothetical protein BCR44DRAFT_1297345 [Catenaria anguillulae PL171]
MCLARFSATRRCGNDLVLLCMVLVLTAPRPRLSPICVSMLCAARDFFAHGIDWNSCCVLVVPEVLQQIGSSSFSAYSNIPSWAPCHTSLFS